MMIRFCRRALIRREAALRFLAVVLLMDTHHLQKTLSLSFELKMPQHSLLNLQHCNGAHYTTGGCKTQNFYRI